jgi:hypothetical protein
MAWERVEFVWSARALAKQEVGSGVLDGGDVFGLCVFAPDEHEFLE